MWVNCSVRGRACLPSLSPSWPCTDSVCPRVALRAFGQRHATRVSGLIIPAWLHASRSALSPCDCRAGLALALAFLRYVHSPVSLQQSCVSRYALVSFFPLDHFLYAIDHTSHTLLRADSYVLYAIEHSNLS